MVLNLGAYFLLYYYYILTFFRVFLNPQISFEMTKPLTKKFNIFNYKRYFCCFASTESWWCYIQAWKLIGTNSTIIFDGTDKLRDSIIVWNIPLLVGSDRVSVELDKSGNLCVKNHFLVPSGCDFSTALRKPKKVQEKIY